MKHHKTPVEYDLEKYERELSTLEHIRDYVQVKIDIAKGHIDMCKHVIDEREEKSVSN